MTPDGQTGRAQRIEPVVKHYAWGSTTYLPGLLGVEPDGRPWAEMWLGTHPSGPSTLDGGRPLADVTGELPFLLKVLAAAEPLSLQAHPTPEQARIGFERGVYPDGHPKPELLVALTPFEAFCGFRPVEATRVLLRDVGVADHLIDALLGRGDPKHALASLCRGLVPHVELVERCRADGHPAAAWVRHLDDLYPGDPSVAATLLLNHVRLEPGEALRIDPGTPHAYLRGNGIELMGASDNVVRGGLTVKTVDIDNFLDVVRSDVSTDPVLPFHTTYDLPLAGVSLTRLGAGELHRSRAHELAIDLAGSAWYLAPGDTLVATTTTFVTTPMAPAAS